MVQLVCLSVLIGFVPAARAAVTVKFAGAGSSAMWQNFALAAYNSGSCPSGGVAPCFHYTGKNFFLRDNRGGAGVIADEPGNIWIVWDSGSGTTAQSVWLYVNVDSVVGNRCYFANPRCLVVTPSPFPGVANLITLTGTIWGGASADVTPPAAVQSAINNTPVTAAMTDIRPEDALYAQCRANSQLDATSTKKGLGYNANVLAGECPVFADPSTSKIGAKIGAQIKSAVSGSTKFAQTIAFNIRGTDPFTNSTITSGTVVPVGAAPIVFLTQRKSNLLGVTAITDTQLQTLYTDLAVAGGNCDASVLGGVAGGINCFMREPLSGTMNTTEFTVFRNNPFQTLYSQEDGV